MESLSKQPSNRRPLWQFLLPPMLLLSVGLHGLVLFIPVAPSEDELVPPPDPEEDGIAITKIEPPETRPARPQAPGGTVKTQPGTAKSTTTAKNSTPTNGRPRNSGSSSSTNRGQSNGRRPNNNASNNNASGNNANGSSGRNTDTSPAVLPPDSRVTTPGLPPAPTEASPADRLEEYVEVFASYQGLEQLDPTELQQREANWLSSFTGGENGATYQGLTVTLLSEIGKVPYGAKICLPGTPNVAEILVVVEADGTLNRDRMQLQSTGYREFNQVAQNLVRTHTFPNTGQPAAYRVAIPVDYDANDCIWPPEQTPLPAEYFALLKTYTGPAGTTPNDLEAAQTKWLETLKEEENLTLPTVNPRTQDPEFPELKNFQAKVNYPLNICLPIAPKTAVWGVVVNPDGTIRGDIQPLRSTGYSAFDTRSKALVEAFSFPTAESAQVYAVEVPVDYNSLLCQKLDADSFATPGGNTTPTPASPANSAGNNPPATSGNALDATRQAQLIAKGRENLAGSSFGSLNVNNPGFAAEIVASDWPNAIQQSCFIADLDSSKGITPAAGATDAFLLTRNADLVDDSLVDLYGTQTNEVGTFCGVPLLAMQDNGATQLFASVVGIGAGNSSGLVVIWPQDPRQ